MCHDFGHLADGTVSLAGLLPPSYPRGPSFDGDGAFWKALGLVSNRFGRVWMGWSRSGAAESQPRAAAGPSWSKNWLQLGQIEEKYLLGNVCGAGVSPWGFVAAWQRWDERRGGSCAHGCRMGSPGNTAGSREGKNWEQHKALFGFCVLSLWFSSSSLGCFSPLSGVWASSWGLSVGQGCARSCEEPSPPQLCLASALPWACLTPTGDSYVIPHGSSYPLIF